MTSAQHMLWMLDEYEVIHGNRQPGLITGKPVGMGGSLGRTEATGYGLVFTLREALKGLNIPPGDTKASVQGFGNVAQYAIELYQQIWGKVICVSCWDQADQTSYSFRKKDGVDPAALRGITDRFGGIDKAKAKELGYEVLPGGGLDRAGRGHPDPGCSGESDNQGQRRQDRPTGQDHRRGRQRADHARRRQGDSRARHLHDSGLPGQRRRRDLLLTSSRSRAI